MTGVRPLVHEPGSGAVRHHPGRHVSRSSPAQRGRDARDRLRGLRDWRAERRRADSGDVRHDRSRRRQLLPADRPRYLMGVGYAPRSRRKRRARHRHVRLRAAHAQCAERPAVHEHRASEHQERRVCRRHAARRCSSATATPAATFRARICGIFFTPAR